jgi:hypothetical protein
VIGDLTFGESFGCLEGGSYHPWVAAIFDSVKSASWLRAVGYYPALESVTRLFIPKALKEMRAKHGAMTVDKVRSRQGACLALENVLTGLEDMMLTLLRRANKRQT